MVRVATVSVPMVSLAMVSVAVVSVAIASVASSTYHGSTSTYTYYGSLEREPDDHARTRLVRVRVSVRG